MVGLRFSQTGDRKRRVSRPSLFREAQVDVHGGKNREDVGLQEGDERLEAGHGETTGEPQRTHRDALQLVDRVNHPELCERQAGGDHKVAGNHVGELTDGQGGRADDQQLKQVDRSQQEIDRPRHTGGEQLVAQIVAEALRADGGDPVLDQCPDSEHERHDHRGVGRHVHTWNDAAQVENEDREDRNWRQA